MICLLLTSFSPLPTRAKVFNLTMSNWQMIFCKMLIFSYLLIVPVSQSILQSATCVEMEILKYYSLSLSLSLTDFRVSDDERNLLYVAASRAKCQLILSPTCVAILKRSGVSEHNIMLFFSLCVSWNQLYFYWTGTLCIPISCGSWALIRGTCTCIIAMIVCVYYYIILLLWEEANIIFYEIFWLACSTVCAKKVQCIQAVTEPSIGHLGGGGGGGGGGEAL